MKLRCENCNKVFCVYHWILGPMMDFLCWLDYKVDTPWTWWLWKRGNAVVLWYIENVDKETKE